MTTWVNFGTKPPQQPTTPSVSWRWRRAKQQQPDDQPDHSRESVAKTKAGSIKGIGLGKNHRARQTWLRDENTKARRSFIYCSSKIDMAQQFCTTTIKELQTKTSRDKYIFFKRKDHIQERENRD